MHELRSSAPPSGQGRQIAPDPSGASLRATRGGDGAPQLSADRRSSGRAAAALAVAFAVWIGAAGQSAAQQPTKPRSPDDDLRANAVHINRTPAQNWPGYGMYLGNGLVLTAAHVPGNFADTKPKAVIDGQEYQTSLVKQGSLDTTDLTLLSVDPATLPVRVRMRRLPLCESKSFAGEAVVVVTPENAAHSHVFAPAMLPQDVRGRFGTAIVDVETTGNSGSGVLDARKTCLLGIISRKINVNRSGARPGAPAQFRTIAKYFVPADEIRAFIPPDVSF